MGLQAEIDAKRSEIRIDGYRMSIGELISLYEHNEIDIHPEFQSFFRWDIWQKSRLIESIFLGIPIPEIFVYQRDDGIWDVIDGQQRLSTIFQFVGILQDKMQRILEPLVLKGTTSLPSLEGIRWGVDDLFKQKAHQRDDLLEDETFDQKVLTVTQRMLFKRFRFHISIILNENDQHIKYRLFQRLNTGGLHLSNQEIRNCTLASINPDMYTWLRELANDENFVGCTNLTDRALLEQYDVELVVRFLVFRNLHEATLKKISDLDEFLTNKLWEMAESKDFDKEKEGRRFKETFELLIRHSEGDSFRKFDATKGRFTGGFIASAFEAIALGIGYNLDTLIEEKIDIEDKVRQIWHLQDFKDFAGPNIPASKRLAKVVPLARKLFKP